MLPNAEPEPFGITEDIVSASSKLTAIDKLLADILPKGERVLIFSVKSIFLLLLQHTEQNFTSNGLGKLRSPAQNNLWRHASQYAWSIGGFYGSEIDSICPVGWIDTSPSPILRYQTRMWIPAFLNLDLTIFILFPQFQQDISRKCLVSCGKRLFESKNDSIQGILGLDKGRRARYISTYSLAFHLLKHTPSRYQSYKSFNCDYVWFRLESAKWSTSDCKSSPDRAIENCEGMEFNVNSTNTNKCRPQRFLS